MNTGDENKGLQVNRKALARLCRRYHILKLSLYGSVLLGKNRSESDLDLLVEFAPGEAPGLIALAALEAELTDLVGGRKVDLRTAQDLSPHFRNEVVRMAETLYAA